MSQATKVYDELCCLWEELVLTPCTECDKSARIRKELIDTVRTKLPLVKYFKLMAGAFIKVSLYPDGRDVLEVIDTIGLPEGEPATIILGTLAGWCACLQFVVLATQAEYYEALDIVLETEVRVIVIERLGD